MESIQKHMNVIYKTSPENSKYLTVPIVALLENNRDSVIDIYVMHFDLTDENMQPIKETVERYGQNVFFVRAEAKDFDGLPPTGRFGGFTVYLEMLAHKYLPASVEKALCFGTDTLVCENIYNYYSLDISNHYMICPTHTHGDVISKHAAFETPQDNIAVISNDEVNIRMMNPCGFIFNLRRLRDEDITIDDYLDAYRSIIDKKIRYIYDQSLLSYMFLKSALLVDGSKYLFSLYDVCSAEGLTVWQCSPAIMHYMSNPKPWRAEFYDLPQAIQLQWNYMFLNFDVEGSNAFQLVAYKSENGIRIHCEMAEIWWHYAELAPNHVVLRTEMERRRNAFLRTISLTTPLLETKEREKHYKIQFQDAIGKLRTAGHAVSVLDYFGGALLFEHTKGVSQRKDNGVVVLTSASETDEAKNAFLNFNYAIEKGIKYSIKLRYRTKTKAKRIRFSMRNSLADENKEIVVVDVKNSSFANASPSWQNVFAEFEGDGFDQFWVSLNGFADPDDFIAFDYIRIEKVY
ncbi:hypothetical protein FACS1894208_11040 [Clostridia bacterium]|nr:hypothetical protein FACS1894208_11040 [Clostridia bacterium]